MNKQFFSILFAVALFVGDPFTAGYFKAPTGETVHWKWIKKTLYVVSVKQCVFNNTGTPRDCTKEEKKMIYKLLKIK